MAPSFQRITLIDDTGLTEEGIAALGSHSRDPLTRYDHDSESENEIIDRIGDSEAIFASWRPNITRSVLESCPSLRYIGMCCTLRDQASTNVDMAAAEELGIVVRGVRDHADQGAVEFILAQLTRLYMGLGCEPWMGVAGELCGKTIGIIGLGAIGRLLADHALPFGMRVLYYSRKERRDLQLTHIEYRSKERLLEESDIVSIHVPRGSMVMGAEEFDRMKGRSIFVSTSLQPCFDTEAFSEWVQDDAHFGILDGCGIEGLSPETMARWNVAYIDRISGWTAEARGRLTESAIATMKAYLAER
jgi:phosphoglycerate dehydrogenase-like enzyme